jgi:hypothetical protein
MHAAGESTEDFLLPSGTHAVCLAADNEQHLYKIADRLSRRNIPHKIIIEPDSPWNGEAMAIGLSPVKDRKPIKRALSRLSLLTERKKDDNHDR